MKILKKENQYRFCWTKQCSRVCVYFFLPTYLSKYFVLFFLIWHFATHFCLYCFHVVKLGLNKFCFLTLWRFSLWTNSSILKSYHNNWQQMCIFIFVRFSSCVYMKEIFKNIVIFKLIMSLLIIEKYFKSFIIYVFPCFYTKIICFMLTYISLYRNIRNINHRFLPMVHIKLSIFTKFFLKFNLYYMMIIPAS